MKDRETNNKKRQKEKKKAIDNGQEKEFKVGISLKLDNQ